MSDHRWNLSLPLLTRELIAQAARRRTYVIRVLLALLAIWLGLALYQAQVRSSYAPQAGTLFGQGDVVFDVLTWMQFVVIYLLLPMQCAGLLTEEKERDTLQLLLLTHLGPWKILWEKLLSRVVPMISLLLVCLPLQALAYGLGGVSVERIAISFCLLLATLFQMGSLGLVASSFHRTTARATVTTLGLVAATLFGLGLLGLIVCVLVESLLGRSVMSELERFYTSALAVFGLSPQQGLFPFFGALHYQMAARVGMAKLPLVVCSLLLIGGQTAGMLGLARFCLWRCANLTGDVQTTRRNSRRERRAAARAAAPASPPPGGTHPVNGLDAASGGSPGPQLASPTERHLSPGPPSAVEFPAPITAPEDLPEAAPVAWRERRRNRSSHWGWLLSLAPVVAVGLTTALSRDRYAGPLVQVVCFIALWLLALLRTIVVSTSLFCGERSRQTLDVLRTLPLTGAELVQQKFRGLWPVWQTYGLAMLANTLWGAYLRGLRVGEQRGWGLVSSHWSVALSFANSLLLPVIELPLIACLGCLTGLLIKGHQRAIWAMLGLLLIWVVGPLVLVVSLQAFSNRTEVDSGRFAQLCSPAAFPVLNEVGELHDLVSYDIKQDLRSNRAYDRDWKWNRALLALSVKYLGTHLLLLLAAWTVLRALANRRLGGPDLRGETAAVDALDGASSPGESTGPPGAAPAGRPWLSVLRARQTANTPTTTPPPGPSPPAPSPPAPSRPAPSPPASPPGFAGPNDSQIPGSPPG